LLGCKKALAIYADLRHNEHIDKQTQRGHKMNTQILESATQMAVMDLNGKPANQIIAYMKTEQFKQQVSVYAEMLKALHKEFKN
jgi:hypothetical protein